MSADDTLQMPEIGIEIPVAEFYEGTDVPRTTDDNSDRSQGTDDSDKEATSRANRAG